MAPFQGPSREELLSILGGFFAKRRLPITLGKYGPQAIVECVDSVFRLRRLELDQDAAKREGDARLARGESWMPEMTWRFLEKGQVLVERRSKKEFIAEIREMDWPFGP